MGQGNKPPSIEPMPAELLKEPLVWFFAEHYRHREVCKQLLSFSTSVEFNEGAFQEVEQFLEVDMPLHIVDEEDDLFPLLRRRCDPDDRIENVLGILSGEHASDMHHAPDLIAIIKKALTDKRGLAAYCETEDIIPPFCQSQKRHIAVENAVVLPIARLRLTEDDLKGLGQRLAARRGLPDPFVTAT